MDSFFVKFIMWGILTALAYHVVVGIRHLMMDFGYWTKPSKQETFRQNFFCYYCRAFTSRRSPRMVSNASALGRNGVHDFIWSVLPPSF